ncbi:Uma2 family endonuclease [Deinococcus cellulosilyticus]|uniref:Putative restriction endonuclease domain-containing protein n=1 Tax=Deinococcus cellulosilyticus (strain DSM 18568 / NBRC 106333 / KACC 11606 / 5516J-15) TaxID=1223518 RepID=A0A511MW97_DEIC1|nr:Uma2 family endonuclease [Deinococcus cellulosilyticus]GEM44853.1 hypothetical protein DC3_04880 [Deinococcus cellulosilyticus NBRC 106333 = KACC 11606]
MTEARMPDPITLTEYLELEETSPVRHEFLYGTIHAQAGTTRRHNQITQNVAFALRQAARSMGGQVYLQNVKFSPLEGVVYYPDVFVTCQNTGSEVLFNDACLVVEVLSRSTQNVDLREKLVQYRLSPSVQTYIIVDQYHALVRVFQKPEWKDQHFTAGEVPVPCLGSSLAVSDVYEGIDFEA